MSFTGTNLARVADALKEFYLPGLRYQLNEKASVLLAQIERNTDSVEGRNIVMAMRFGRIGGIGNRADDGELPTPNSRRTIQAKWETKNLFARLRITDKTIQSSRGNAGAFANLLQTEIEDCETDIKQDLSRQVVGDGVGVIGTITSTRTAAGSDWTVTVASTQFLVEGMLVDIWTGSVFLNQGIEILAVNDDTNTITLPAALGVTANGHTMFISGNRNMELTGLRAVFEGASLYGLDRTTFPVLNAIRVNVAGAISEAHIQRGIDEADRRAGADVNFFITSFGVRRAYQGLLTAQKQLVNTMNLKGGWTAISYNGKAIVADKYMIAGRMYGLDLSDWAMYHMGDFDWMDRDGGMLTKVPNRPAYEATLVRYCDIGCQKPRGQVEYFGITEA